jgi:NAD(P)-dependent dehydrogenase (short-subunit alcohol dehydrogenase family)
MSSSFSLEGKVAVVSDGRADHFGHAVAFLRGPGSKRITGQILPMDGGQFLGPT